MQPITIKNPHKTPLTVRIAPGQIDIAVPPGDQVQLEVYELAAGAMIEIEPTEGPGLELTIPSDQFRIRQKA